MIRYESLIDLVVTWVQGQLWWPAAEGVVLVRDLDGRVRLVVDGAVAVESEALFEGLAVGWTGGILSTGGSADEREVARVIRGRASQWPSRWPVEVDDGFGNRIPVDRQKWKAYERFTGKEPWLIDAPAKEAWPLVAQAPKVIAFFSFKGGVGRTTSMALLAARYAREGRKVVCIDLDLEAPGLGEVTGAPGEVGTLDLLLGFHISGEVPSDHVIEVVRQGTVAGASVAVIPAGGLDDSYVEKVARLDYLSAEGQSPVEEGLRTMLRTVRSTLNPELIFLDARAGIHDLAGMAVLSLAHASVVVVRPERQSKAGLSLVLPLYAARRHGPERRLLLALAFVEKTSAEVDRWRGEIYDVCLAAGLYGEDEEPPSLDDDQAPHAPVVLHENPVLARSESLVDVVPQTLDDPDLIELQRRLDALVAPEEPDAAQ